MSSQRDKPFFVGYLPIPKQLVAFLGVFAVCFVAGLGLAALALSSTQDDPGDGAFQWGAPFEETGFLELRPYPVFRTTGAEGGAPKTYMLTGQGKRGVFDQARENQGVAVTVRGVPVKRGDLTMVQVGGVTQVEDAEGAFDMSEPVPLGRWRLSGEICDGKCYAGAMRPGRGLAHKACADLCITGGIPPVFVSTGPVAGRNFFLMTDANGNVMGDEIKDLLALYVEIEGDVERLDDLLVFKADMDTARVLR
ncbi:hypothetical protein JM93_02694 [Roseibium hamelinense]|uniref:Uncharacterized protein n=1 Tax=Roseibium hamelinense TaxID=150831 RepID=A0A562SXF2_9HYPH|nr:hypothetical protein [Roseibium hamelinense]MTI44821.1 hypothetical protein [Roseibium hamelinense]TWI85987.1 hypothetical protein JM93_02694 [Roseibium hamelinense]